MYLASSAGRDECADVGTRARPVAWSEGGAVDGSLRGVVHIPRLAPGAQQVTAARALIEVVVEGGAGRVCAAKSAAAGERCVRDGA